MVAFTKPSDQPRGGSYEESGLIEVPVRRGCATAAVFRGAKVSRLS